MELTQEQIGANVMAQLDKLREQKAKLEAQTKDRLAAVNAEIAALERLAGLRQKPGKRAGSSTAASSPKASEKYIDLAKAVLSAHEGEPMTSSEITEIAISTSLWADPPKSAKANMGRALKGMDSEQTGIYRTDDDKFFVPSSDSDFE